jgi:hypothetical protein
MTNYLSIVSSALLASLIPLMLAVIADRHVSGSVRGSIQHLVAGGP